MSTPEEFALLDLPPEELDRRLGRALTGEFGAFDSTFVVDDAERQKAQAREVLARLA
jgi:hypothetical protein